MERLYFPGIDIRTVLRRLRRLQAADAIRRSGGLDFGELVWLLTEKSGRALGVETIVDKVNRNQLQHWLALIHKVVITKEGFELHYFTGVEQIKQGEALASPSLSLIKNFSVQSSFKGLAWRLRQDSNLRPIA